MPGGSIFCDGACKGNGKAGAVAGWAWAYWPGAAAGDPTAWGAGKPVGTPTNQRAELTALLEALRWWSGRGPVTIYTDSMYAIKCMTLWGPAWKKKGWKRDSGEPLQNLDLIQPLVALWADRPKSWSIKHVYGHQKGPSAEAYGNNWVDQAAVAAAAGAPVLGPAPAPAPTPTVILKKKVTGPYVQSDLRKWFGDGTT